MGSAGRFNDWWTEEDTKLFKSKCSLMAEQVERWKFVPESVGGGPALQAKATEYRMNAELTMGENLSDIGGLSLACQALQARLGERCRPEHLAAFFKSWANVWKSKKATALVIQQLNTGPHAPEPFRCNLVSNVDAFYKA